MVGRRPETRLHGHAMQSIFRAGWRNGRDTAGAKIGLSFQAQGLYCSSVIRFIGSFLNDPYYSCLFGRRGQGQRRPLFGLAALHQLHRYGRLLCDPKEAEQSAIGSWLRRRMMHAVHANACRCELSRCVTVTGHGASALLTVCSSNDSRNHQPRAQQEQRSGLRRLKSYETHATASRLSPIQWIHPLSVQEKENDGFNVEHGGERVPCRKTDPLVALVLNGVSAGQKRSCLIKRLLLLLLAWREAS